MKSKLVFGLVMAMLLLAFAQSSFAQISVQGFSAASPREINTNKTAQAGDPESSGSGITISGSVIANAILTTTVLRLNFPVELTSSDGFGASNPIPVLDPLRIDSTAGLFTGAVITRVEWDDGEIDIQLPGDSSGTLVSGSLRLLGIRLDVNGATAPINGTLTLLETGNNYILAGNTVTAIDALGDGIDSIETDNVDFAGSATVFTNQTMPDPDGTMIINEGFDGAWRTPEQSAYVTGLSTPNGTEITLTFTGIPEDVELDFSINGDSDPAFTINGGANASVEDGDDIVIVFTGTDLGDTERIILDYTVDLGGVDADVIFDPANITVTATMSPIGDALFDLAGNEDFPDGSDGYPVFAEAQTPALTLVSIIAASTDLLIPFAVVDLGFDTGISLSNTTADPFADDAGGATAASGVVRVDIFPRTTTGAGTPVSRTTSATFRPGVGLSSSGELVSGGTWTVLLSQLLSAAGQSGSFTGYIFIHAEFLNAHGSSFVSNFSTFTSFSPVLVLFPPQSPGGDRDVAGAESLGM
jgi:hypothetical protein